eukprot:TRINITY_DN4504_c5_g1_i1.p1 TRINITY_DN4504_c5_g1~~TRINITY_DN4504_c5_g1_i1.p1  ORF type:complete len:496 (+),score=81.69 TRINITY_DN4504_c5_g1_i1:57-1544(+)
MSTSVRDPRNINYTGASEQPKSEAVAAAAAATRDPPEKRTSSGKGKGGKKDRKGHQGNKGGKSNLMLSEERQRPLQLFYDCSGQTETPCGERRVISVAGTKGNYRLILENTNKDEQKDEVAKQPRKAKKYVQKQYVLQNNRSVRELRFTLKEHHSIIYREICKLGYATFFSERPTSQEDNIYETSLKIVLGRHLFQNSNRGDFLSPNAPLCALDVLESLKNNDVSSKFDNEIVDEAKLPDLTGFTKSDVEHAVIHQLKGTRFGKSVIDLTLQRLSSESDDLGLVSAVAARGGRTLDVTSFSDGSQSFRARILGNVTRMTHDMVQTFANETKLVDNKLWMPLQNSMRVTCYREKVFSNEAHVGIYTKGMLEVHVSRVYTTGTDPFYYVEVSSPQLTEILQQTTAPDANRLELFRSYSQAVHMFLCELVSFLKWGDFEPETEPELWERFNQKMLDEYKRVEESKVFWSSEKKTEDASEKSESGDEHVTVAEPLSEEQ